MGGACAAGRFAAGTAGCSGACGPGCRRAVELAAPDCLTIFGGDTVFAVLRELGIEEAEPAG